MTAEIVDRVLRSRRYREVDPNLLRRLVAEELPRARSSEDAVKRVKRRLHQAVGAFTAPRKGGDPLAGVRAAWDGDVSAQAMRDACAAVLRTHASTRERVPHLDDFYPGIWAHTGVPRRLLDIGCGLNPLALPWMGLDAGAAYLAAEIDRAALDTGGAFLDLVGQPHELIVADAVTEPPAHAADVALLLKLVTTLDRQDPAAAARLLGRLQTRHAVVSFALRSISGRATGQERTYRARFERLLAEMERVRKVAEASVPGELMFVLTLADG